MKKHIIRAIMRHESCSYDKALELYQAEFVSCKRSVGYKNTHKRLKHTGNGANPAHPRCK